MATNLRLHLIVMYIVYRKCMDSMLLCDELDDMYATLSKFVMDFLYLLHSVHLDRLLAYE